MEQLVVLIIPLQLQVVLVVLVVKQGLVLPGIPPPAAVPLGSAMDTAEPEDSSAEAVEA